MPARAAASPHLSEQYLPSSNGIAAIAWDRSQSKLDQWLEHLAPFRKNYKHHETGEDNGDSHLKALLIHHEVIVPITAGKLDLGTWQRIFYAEFDGQRDKRVIVKVMGE